VYGVVVDPQTGFNVTTMGTHAPGPVAVVPPDALEEPPEEVLAPPAGAELPPPAEFELPPDPSVPEVPPDSAFALLSVDEQPPKRIASEKLAPRSARAVEMRRFIPDRILIVLSYREGTFS